MQYKVIKIRVLVFLVLWAFLSCQGANYRAEMQVLSVFSDFVFVGMGRQNLKTTTHLIELS